MSESTHRILKTEFLKGKLSQNKQAHEANLKAFVKYYNNQRYPGELFGLTPMEVIQGEIPNKNHYKVAIKQAQKEQIITNQVFNACGIGMSCR